MAAIDALPGRHQVRRAGGGQGRRDRGRRGRRRARRSWTFLEERRFGAGRVVVEEHLVGEELSLLALCDGERAVPLAPGAGLQADLRRRRGARTPAAWAPTRPCPDAERRARRSRAAVHQPVVDELRARGTPFHGVLYAGLMLTADGPKVLEFNVRFGDPETQAVLPRLRSRPARPADARHAARRAGGRRARLGRALGGHARAGQRRLPGVVVDAATSSPGSTTLAGGVEVTHAGTARRDGGAIVTAGGRVLNVTALGADPAAARDAAYAAADQIQFDGRQLRRDIALRAVERVGA